LHLQEQAAIEKRRETKQKQVKKAICRTLSKREQRKLNKAIDGVGKGGRGKR
jgi:hypothetical protein